MAPHSLFLPPPLFSTIESCLPLCGCSPFPTRRPSRLEMVGKRRPDLPCSILAMTGAAARRAQPRVKQ
jgi:hypothetical protein